MSMYPVNNTLWNPIATIPLKENVLVKTAKGLVRRAKVKPGASHVTRNGVSGIACDSRDAAQRCSDIVALAWQPVPADYPILTPSRQSIGSRSLKHGHEINRLPSPTYRCWTNMLTRCRNPAAPQYEKYGKRGIKVCPRWENFELFLQDMGERPSLRHSIDRYPNRDGNYELGNCRWATPGQQRRNRHSSRAVIRSDGIRFDTIVDAAEALGDKKYRTSIRYACIVQKVYRGFSWRFA
jgi:hypothetical protein